MRFFRKKPKLSVVIAFFNMRREAARTLYSLTTDYQRDIGIDDYEVIVVNDGSIDKTAAIVESLANDNPKVRLVNHPINQGYGGALQSGFRAATKEWVLHRRGRSVRYHRTSWPARSH